MSRAFVKEEDSDAIEELPDKPVSPHPNYVTPAGLRQLQRRLADCLAQEQALKQRNDLNARQELPLIRQEIRYLEKRIGSAIVVDPATQPRDRVAFGTTVEVEDETGARHTFQIVSEDEADARHGKISWVSPLARALRDAEVGDVVVWRRPTGDLALEVIAISQSDDAPLS